MTGQDESDKTHSVSGAPVDFDRLDVIRDRFATDDRFTQIVDRPEFAPERFHKMTRLPDRIWAEDVKMPLMRAGNNYNCTI